MGIIAGIAGCIVGVIAGLLWSGAGFSLTGPESPVALPVILTGLLLAPVLALTAGLLPSVMAANQDPADILCEQ